MDIYVKGKPYILYYFVPFISLDILILFWYPMHIISSLFNWVFYGVTAYWLTPQILLRQFGKLNQAGTMSCNTQYVLHT